jgi:hypothetical protein
MFEELQLLKEIVGDLSSVGGWIAGSWILYKFIVAMTWLIGGGFLIKKLAELAAKHFGSDISKEEGLQLKQALVESEQETERVKHMYKLLKEKKDVSGAA